ncbi:MAG: hypothetical protein ACRDFX_12040 [Chloroflexota bacterium]
MHEKHKQNFTRFEDAVRALDSALTELARDVIRGSLDLSLPENREFLAHPDDRQQHQAHWHHWGIISHTRVFLQHFEVDIPHLLKGWGLWDPVATYLDQRIDGVTKWDLLKITILLHDIGKFAARTRGRTAFHFSGHEVRTGEIIRQNIDLASYGLTKDQIEYVASTAEDHFVLGRLRKRIRERGAFTIDFVKGEEFRNLALQIRSEHPDDYREIGILFLGDSLAKTKGTLGPEEALDQHGVNVDAAHRYLQIVMSAPC